MIKPYYDYKGITIYHGDCREILLELDPVDLLLTDPPYGIGMDKGFDGFGGFGKPIIRRKYKEDHWDLERPDSILFDLCLKSAKLSIIWGGNFLRIFYRGQHTG